MVVEQVEGELLALAGEQLPDQLALAADIAMAKQHIAEVGIPDLRRDAFEHHAHGGANAVERLAAMQLPGHRTGRAHGIEDQLALELAALAIAAAF